MPNLACRHQSKQGPCRFRCGGGGTLIPPVVEPVTPGVLAPAAVRVLDRDQPIHGLAYGRVLMVEARGVERPQRRPGDVDVVYPPTTVPRSLRKLGAAKIGDAVSYRLAVLGR